MEENAEIRKLMELCDRLPEVNQGYIMNLNKSTATKIIYVYDLLRFNEYLTEKKNVNRDTINFGAYSEITYDDIRKYFRINIEKGNGYSTIQRTRTVLNGWFNLSTMAELFHQSLMTGYLLCLSRPMAGVLQSGPYRGY